MNQTLRSVCTKGFGCSVLAVFLALLAVPGCSNREMRMYSGAPVDPSREAIIRADNAGWRDPDVITIDKVDGTQLPGEVIFTGVSTGVRKVYVLPGKHRLTAQLTRGDTYAKADLWLVAEPGGAYIIKAYSGLRPAIWLENERTGKRVGGIAGSDDEPPSDADEKQPPTSVPSP